MVFDEHCAYSKIFGVRLRALVITWCVHNESASKTLFATARIVYNHKLLPHKVMSLLWRLHIKHYI